MKRSTYSITLLILAIIAISPVPSQAQKADAGKVARGKHLVEKIAMCADCHTPLNEMGQPDRNRWLQGAPVSIQPVRPDPNWAMDAPKIAGLPGWTDEAATRFLETGLNAAGYKARSPMRQYRLPREDAEAIVAYLKSLRN